jgi:hypothetical protein
MRRKMTENELSILTLLDKKGQAMYADIEPLMVKDHHDIYWTTFSTICSLIQAGIITAGNHPANYTLTAYGRSKALELL